MATGVIDLAVGALGDDDGGTNRGAVWILFLEVDPYELAVIRIEDAIAEKQEALARIDAALEKEWDAYEALEELLESGDYGDLSKSDIVAAKQNIHSAIRQEERSKEVLDKSIEKLKDALAALGIEPLDPNLVAYWKFDEGSGTTATDSAGNNDGTLNGDPNWVAGKIGDYALDFDGNGDYIAGYSSPFDFEDTTFTVCLWFKRTETDHVMISEGSYQGGWQISDGAGANPGGIKVMLKRADSTNGAYRAVTADTYNDGNWHHVAAVITTSTTDTQGNSADLYVDGSLVFVSEVKSYPYGSSDDNWRIGARPTDPHYFDGTLDDVRIYNRALSAEEIWQLYQDGLGGPGKGKK